MYPRVVMGPLLTVVTLLQVLHSAMGTGVLPGLSYLPPRPVNNLFEVGTPAFAAPPISSPIGMLLPALDLPPLVAPPAVQQGTTPQQLDQPSPPAGSLSSGEEALPPPSQVNPPPPTPVKSNCGTPCSFTYEPVCGSDGVTYTNDCTFSVATCNNPYLLNEGIGSCASGPSGRPSVPAPSFPPPPPPPSQPSPRPPTVVIPFPDDIPSFQTSPGSGVIPFPPSLGALGNPGTFDLLSPSTGCSEACTKIFVPLCGTDGVTYNNKCLLDIAICKGSSSGLTLSVAFEGTCDSVSVPDASPLIESVDIRGSSPSFSSSSSSSLSTCDMQCTKIFSPVCGDDGNSYNSPCLLEVASCEAVNSGGPSITVSYVGQCVPSDTALFIAAMSPNTASGSAFLPAGGAQFDSQQDPSTLTSSFSPQSPCPEACTKIFTPVCGSDDQTYNNECVLNVAACKSRSLGVDVLFKAFEGPCVAALPRGPVCDQACEKTFLPVCGSDGETYNNECLLNLADCLSPFASIIYANDGPCEIKSAAGLSTDPRPMISTEPRPNIDTGGAFQSPNAAIEQDYLPPV